MIAAKIDPRTETYRDVEALIQLQVTKFHRRFGGDRDELVSVANEGYCKAYNDYEPTKGAFTTAVWTYVWNEMRNHLRNTIRDSRYRSGSKVVFEEIEEPAKSDFQTSDFAEQLGEDARMVLWLIVDPPEEIATTAQAKGGHAVNLKSTVKQYLHDIGWGAKRIVESFTEVADVLADL